jgi:hypothetical protein
MQGISLRPSSSNAAAIRGERHQAHHSHLHTNAYGPPSTDWFQFSAPVTVTAGQTFSLTVTVRDQFDGVDTGYTGTVSFADQYDPGATVPAPYTFKASDKGVHTFTGFVFDLAFVHDLTVQDNLGNRSFTSVPVVPAVPKTVVVTTLSSIITGRPMPLFVTLRDQFGNVAWNTTDAISFSSTDLSAALPASYVFTPSDYGSHRFTVTMNTGSASPRTITVKDTTRNIQGTASVQVATAGTTKRYIVTTTNLGSECGSSGASDYSLTCAINDANSDSSSHPNDAELIQFDIPSATDSGCTTGPSGFCKTLPQASGGPYGGVSAGGIKKSAAPVTDLPPITASYLTIDGTSETGGAVGGYAFPTGLTYKANTNPLHSAAGDDSHITIQIDGSNADTGSDGLQVIGNSVVIKGLSITSFGGAGIDLYSSGANANQAMGATITGSFIGITPANQIGGNGTGIAMLDFPGLETVGGASPVARNLVSASTNSGIDEGTYCDPSQSCPNVGHNTFQGNYIGLDASGSMHISSESGGAVQAQAAGLNLAGNDQAGVNGAAGLYGEQQFDQVGGFASDAGNIISGNGGWGFEVGAHTTVQGNDVGTDPTGTNAAPNSQILATNGDLAAQALGADAGGGYDYVGGVVSAARNLFSGNPQIQLEDSGGYNVVQGNYAGTNAAGSAALPCTMPSMPAVCTSIVGPAGVEASGGGDFIGGTLSGSGNVFGGANVSGEFGLWTNGGNDLIQGNRAGVSSTSNTPIPNGDAGIYLDGGGDIVGGTTKPAANSLNSNGLWGVLTDAGPNYVEGNTIDSNGSGGVSSKAGEDVIGGPTSAAANEIGGNGGPGILFDAISGFAQNNLIGISTTNASIPNRDGIDVENASACNVAIQISSNAIAHNTGAGVFVDTHNGEICAAYPDALISQNSTSSNGGLGIDLAPAGVVNCTDSPPGPNNEEKCPVITSANTSISGTAPNGSVVEVFIATNEADDQNHGEGKTYVGTATANGSGAWTLSPPFVTTPAAGQLVTATATQPETASSPAVTSEFSANMTYQNPPRTTLASPPNTFASYSGRYASNNSTRGNCPPFCQLTESGTGTSTYIGASSVNVNALADYSHDPSLTCAAVSGTMVLTSSSGDKLNTTIAGTTCNGAAACTHNDSGTFTFTGGTGKYMGAAGGGSYSGQRTGNPSTCAVNDANHRFTLTLKNTSLSVPAP